MSIEQLLAELRAVGLSNRRLANTLQVTERQVQRWADGKAEPRDPYLARLLALQYIVMCLTDELAYSLGQVERWLYAPCRELAGAVPIELIRAGKRKHVIAAIERIITAVEDEVSA